MKAKTGKRKMRIELKESFFTAFLVLICALSPSICRGQAEATLAEPEMLMGTVANLTIDVPLPYDSAKVDFPILKEAELQKQKYVPLLNDTVELLVKHTKTLRETDGRFAMRYLLQIQAFDSGYYRLPPFEFRVSGKNVESNSLELTVLPVKVTAQDLIDDFSDVAEPFELNPNPEKEERDTNILLWITVGLAILLLLLIIYLYIRYRRTGRILPGIRQLSPSQDAIKRLKKLQEQKLPEKGKTKEYYTRLTDILRKYLNRQFGIRTIEKTSSEIMVMVENNDFLSQYEGILKSIFETSDFVKFAKVNPSVVENDRCLSDAEKFILSSRPEEETKEKEGGKA